VADDDEDREPDLEEILRSLLGAGGEIDPEQLAQFGIDPAKPNPLNS